MPVSIIPKWSRIVGQQDAEAGAVELVDGVEAEQHHQRVDRAVADDLCASSRAGGGRLDHQAAGCHSPST